MPRSSRWSLATLVLRASFASPLLAAVAGGQSSPVAAARIDSIFAKYTAAGSPGCAVAVSRAGEVAFAKGYGLADLEHDVPITPQTPFYIASTSKQFTAYSIILLARDGVLSLDDDVRKWVPELHDFGHRITVRHLVNHTSGLRDYFDLAGSNGWEFDGLLTDAEFLRLVGRQRGLNFVPGSAYSYSNTGYVLLSIIVKRASGKSLADFARERIFTPLGMTRSEFRDDHRRLIAGRAFAYSPVKGGFEMAVPNFDVVGDGGLFSTVEDLAKWDANYYAPLSGHAEAWRLMRERAVLASGDTITYAGGITVSTHRGTPSIAHGGAFGGYRAELKRLPERRVAVAVLCNHAMANTGQLADAVLDVVAGDGLAPNAPAATPTLALTPDDRAALIGRWISRILDRWFIIDADSTGALVATSMFGRAPLAKRADGRFALGRFPVEIRLRQTPLTGLVREVSFSESGWEPLDAVVRKQGALPAGLAGRFVSGETGATLELKVQGDTLVGTGSLGRTLRFSSLGGDRFVDGPMVLSAAPGASRILLSTGRAIRVAFDRQ